MTCARLRLAIKQILNIFSRPHYTYNQSIQLLKILHEIKYNPKRSIVPRVPHSLALSYVRMFTCKTLSFYAIYF